MGAGRRRRATLTTEKWPIHRLLRNSQSAAHWRRWDAREDIGLQRQWQYGAHHQSLNQNSRALQSTTASRTRSQGRSWLRQSAIPIPYYEMPPTIALLVALRSVVVTRSVASLLRRSPACLNVVDRASQYSNGSLGKPKDRFWVRCDDPADRWVIRIRMTLGTVILPLILLASKSDHADGTVKCSPVPGHTVFESHPN